MSDYKSRSQWQDDVLVVWMENQSINDFAYRV